MTYVNSFRYLPKISTEAKAKFDELFRSPSALRFPTEGVIFLYSPAGRKTPELVHLKHGDTRLQVYNHRREHALNSGFLDEVWSNNPDLGFYQTGLINDVQPKMDVALIAIHKINGLMACALAPNPSNVFDVSQLPKYLTQVSPETIEIASRAEHKSLDLERLMAECTETYDYRTQINDLRSLSGYSEKIADAARKSLLLFAIQLEADARKSKREASV